MSLVKNEIILYGIGGLLLLFIVYKTLQKIGLIDDKNDKGQENLKESGNAGSPLNQGYWLKYLKKDKPPMSLTTASAVCKRIFDAKGFIYDSDGEALGVIRQLSSKVQVSYVSMVFNALYKRDLAEFLDFMSDANMTLAFNHINKLKIK